MARSTADVVVVGAGFAGVYALHKFREVGLSVQVYDKAGGIGGTWWWNQYPGCRCDIPSLDYQYSFSPALAKKWKWSEKYSDAQEIASYIDWVAEELGLKDDIQLDTEVTSARYDEARNVWTVRTNTGDVTECTYLVWGTGCLSQPQAPKFAGLENFKGEWYHTGWWPRTDPDWSGKRVAVVGTGSSGVQIIQTVAPLCGELTVFQRTPNYVQDAFNVPLEDAAWQERNAIFEENAIAKRRSQFGIDLPPPATASQLSKDEAMAIIEEKWNLGGLPLVGAFNDIIIDTESNKLPAEYFATKIREKVSDPDVAELLIPSTYYYGTKRVCLGIGYYETYNRENVTLVPIKSNPIDHISERGIVLADGTEYESDIIVFATGFDAMTGALNAIEIVGEGGKTLKDAWANGPAAYLGIAVAGFPNMFTVTGPGSPSVFTNVVVSIEQHIDWLADAITALRANGVAKIEPSPEAQAAWVASIAETAEATLMVKTDSWYIGANIPGKPRVFLAYMLGIGTYQDIIDDVAAKNFEGFELTPA